MDNEIEDFSNKDLYDILNDYDNAILLNQYIFNYIDTNSLTNSGFFSLVDPDDNQSTAIIKKNDTYDIFVKDQNNQSSYLTLQKNEKNEIIIFIEKIITPFSITGKIQKDDFFTTITSFENFFNNNTFINKLNHIYKSEDVTFDGNNLEKNDYFTLKKTIRRPRPISGSFSKPGPVSPDVENYILKNYVKVTKSNIIDFNIKLDNNNNNYTSDKLKFEKNGYISLAKPLSYKDDTNINLSGILNIIPNNNIVLYEASKNFLKADKNIDKLLDEKEFINFQNMFKKKCCVEYICGLPVILNRNC